MEKVSIIGLDLAKNTIQVHGAGADGSVIFRRKVSSTKLLTFLPGVHPCTVAMEACAGSHYWATSLASRASSRALTARQPRPRRSISRRIGAIR